MQILCDKGHKTECNSVDPPRECPECGSRKVTYVLGELKRDKKKGIFGHKKGDVVQVEFKRTGRMEELDEKYGKKF